MSGPTLGHNLHSLVDPTQLPLVNKSLSSCIYKAEQLKITPPLSPVPD